MISVLVRIVDHRFTAAHASQFLDGDLSDAGRRRIERHTAVCPQCRGLLRSLRRMIDALTGLDRARSTGIADDVVQRLRRES